METMRHGRSLLIGIVIALAALSALHCGGLATNTTTTDGTDNASDGTDSGTDAETETATITDAAALDGQANVSTSQYFTYTFTEPVDTATVTAASLYLVEDATTAAAVAGKASLDACDVSRAIPAGVSCDSFRICRVQPDRALNRSTAYHVCVTTDIRYRDGTAFAGYAARFTTTSEAAADATPTAGGIYRGDRAGFSDATYTERALSDIASDFMVLDDEIATATGFDGGGQFGPEHFAEELLDNFTATANATTPDSLRGTSLLFDACGEATTESDTHIMLVPEQYATIQAAIDAAKNLQIILVTGGQSYTENLHISGKFVHLLSIDADDATLYPADDAAPTLTLSCNGGALIAGFRFETGSVGIKAASSSLGVLTIAQNTFYNVETGIVVNGAAVSVTDNAFFVLNDAIHAVKAKGQIAKNTFTTPGGVAVYAKFPIGLTLWGNTITAPGLGAIFVRGGSAIIDQNTLNLQSSGFGIFTEYTDGDLGIVLEITKNTITQALGNGILVLGKGDFKTKAYLANNVVTGATITEDPKLAWMTYSTASDTTLQTALINGAGILTMDAMTITTANTTNNNIRGISYQRSCGSITGNTAKNNYFGIITITSGDTDGCAAPTLENNDASENSMQNIASDAGLTVPPPPEPVEPSN